ncbi:NAD(P)/FAD-dependent oxidoreductase [Maricaulis sp.]|uniref:NAD(P)/FAD-dependent oxidoreductase n=1 Tax=Maricaulis sp. TaxID=1486257 RepID=UPI002B2703F8|nr:FAD-dependent oxidoreductase [Maricaulis sp.]
MTQAHRRIAVIGSGISGLAAAWRLSTRHDVTLFEAAGRLGGHANTADIDIGGTQFGVDTGFIVYNPRNYPNFVGMLDHLQVSSSASDMSFAASISDGGFEYSSNPSGLFAQRRNLLRPRMWRMIADIMRLNRHARDDSRADTALSLDEFLQHHGYSEAFREDHILPMCAAIWSSPVDQMRGFPADAFFRFFLNHGLLQLTDRPAWRTVTGGSRAYVQALSAANSGDIKLATPVRQVRRTASGVTLTLDHGHEADFDDVVFACHSDQALKLLGDADTEETSLLSAIRYRPNTAVLHTDDRFMPRRRAAWASWNYLERGERDSREISLTYWMNRLQPLPTETPVFVTLNPTSAPDPDLVLRTDQYAHPVFDQAALTAQADFGVIQGRRGTWYSGAWLGSGFHEDGLQSGLRVADAIGADARPWSAPDMNSRIAWTNQHLGQPGYRLAVAAE